MNTDGNYEHSFVHFNDASSSNSYQKLEKLGVVRSSTD